MRRVFPSARRHTPPGFVRRFHDATGGIPPPATILGVLSQRVDPLTGHGTHQAVHCRDELFPRDPISGQNAVCGLIQSPTSPHTHCTWLAPKGSTALSPRCCRGVRDLRLPAIPPGTFGTADDEADEPEDERDNGKNPEKVDGKPESAQEQDEQQDSEYNTHDVTPVCTGHHCDGLE